eukprot:gene10236-8153_t
MAPTSSSCAIQACCLVTKGPSSLLASADEEWGLLSTAVPPVRKPVPVSSILNRLQEGRKGRKPWAQALPPRDFKRVKATLSYPAHAVAQVFAFLAPASGYLINSEHSQPFPSCNIRMVRSCQAEESVSEFFDGLLRQRLPTQDDGQEGLQCSGATSSSSSAKSGTKKSSSASKAGGGGNFNLEEEWLVEHAMQVSRMLPGGVCLLGLYVFCPESSFQSGVSQISSALSSLNTSLSPQEGGSGSKEFLALHVDSTTKKMTMKAIPRTVTMAPSGLKPCELKFGPSISSLVCIRCRYHVQLSVPSLESQSKLQDCLESVVVKECTRIKGGLATVSHSGLDTEGHTLPSDDAPLVDALQLSKSATDTTIPTVSFNLLVPMQAAGEGKAPPSAGAATGFSSISGVVEGLVYAHKREPFSRAVAEVKSAWEDMAMQFSLSQGLADICNTLQHRVDLLVEDALSMEEEQKAEESVDGKALPPAHPLLQTTSSTPSTALAMPSRVQMSWKAGMLLCDYLMPGEEDIEVRDRASSLLAFDVASPKFKVDRLETPAEAPKKLPSWQPNVLQGRATAAAAKSGGGSASSNSCTPVMMGGAAAAVVAAVAVLAPPPPPEEKNIMEPRDMLLASGAGMLSMYMSVSGFFQPVSQLPDPVWRYPMHYVM